MYWVLNAGPLLNAQRKHVFLHTVRLLVGLRPLRSRWPAMLWRSHYDLTVGDTACTCKFCKVNPHTCLSNDNVAYSMRYPPVRTEILIPAWWSETAHGKYDLGSIPLVRVLGFLHAAYTV